MHSIKLIEAYNDINFESSLNEVLRKIYYDGGDIIDIKYQLIRGSTEIHQPDKYSAMIIYTYELEEE